jgi:hypothetical protein
MKRIIIYLLGVASPIALLSQNSVLTTAVPYMRIAADARAAGMGDAGITASPDAAAIFWNGAKSLFAHKQLAAQFSYTSWFREVGAKDIYLLSASGYIAGDSVFSVTGGIRFYSQGKVDVTNLNGDDLGSFKPRDWDISFGYNRKINDKLGIGVAIRYIRSNLGGGSFINGGYALKANTLAGDVSLYYKGETKDGAGWNAGLSLSNLGGKMGYAGSASTDKDFLPANLGIGVSYGWVFDDKNKIRANMEINKLLVPVWPNQTGNTTTDSANAAEYRKRTVVNSWFDSFSDESGFLKSLAYSLGVEYMYDKKFGARVGYYTEDQIRGNRKYYTAGLSAYFKGGGIHISYLVPAANSNRNVLNNTLRLGVVFE